MSLSGAGSQTGCNCKTADTLGQWPLLAHDLGKPARGVQRISRPFDGASVAVA